MLLLLAVMLHAVMLHGPAMAVEPNERLPDPAMESRARIVSAELRCLVCQNESIDESHAELARDIRGLVRERIRAGDSNVQATQAVVDRYGDFVLLRPPVKPATYVLWFAPLALVLTGFAGTALWLRRRGAAVLADTPLADTPLTEPERQRLDRLLKDDA